VCIHTYRCVCRLCLLGDSKQKEQPGTEGYMVTKTFHPKLCKSGLTETTTVCPVTLEKHPSLLTTAVRRLQFSLDILPARVHAPSATPEPEPAELCQQEAAQHCLHCLNTAPKPNKLCSPVRSFFVACMAWAWGQICSNTFKQNCS